MFQKFYCFTILLPLAFTFWGALLPTPACAQNFEEEIRRLKGELASLEHSSTYVDHLNRISFAFRRISTDSSRTYARMACQAAQEMDYLHGLAVSFKNLGNSYLKSNQHLDSALIFYKQSMEVAERINDYYTLAACHNNLGFHSVYRGNLDEGMSYILKGLEIFDSHAETFKKSQFQLKYRMLGNLGDLYCRSNDLDKSLYYLEACVGQAEEADDKVILANYLDNLAAIQVKLKKYSLAEANFYRAISLQRELADYQSEIHSLLAFHKLKVEQKEFHRAEELLRQALKSGVEKGFSRAEFETYTYLCNLFLIQKRFQKALQYGQKAQNLPLSDKSRHLTLVLLGYLGKVHENLGDSAMAYKYLLQKTSLQDSLRKLEDAQLATKLESQYRDNQHKLEIKLLGEAQARKTYQIQLLSTFIGVLLGLLGLSYYLFQSKRTQSILLAQRNQEHEEVKRALEESNERLTKYIDSNLQLENFAYMASHDLRAPLVNITAFSSRLLETSKGKLDETEYTLLSFLYKNSQSMEALINSLLQYSRVNTQKLQTERIIPEEALCEVLDELVTSIEHRGANISVSETMASSIYADKVKLKQIFQNLLLNAVKFCPYDRNPSISVTLSSHPSHWQIAVKDNGIGISKEHQDQIFLLFRKLHPSEEYTGSGIGLAAVKRLVEQHNGAIWVKSLPGEGSTFYFTIHKNLLDRPKSVH